MSWKYADELHLTVSRINSDGSGESCFVSEITKWLEEGNKPLPADIPPPPTYQELRVREYPPIEDYLDGIVKADDLQVQKYIDDCLAVKAKHPKKAKNKKK